MLSTVESHKMIRRRCHCICIRTVVVALRTIHRTYLPERIPAAIQKKGSYLKAGFEAGAKAEAEAKMVAKQNAVFILIYYLERIVR